MLHHTDTINSPIVHQQHTLDRSCRRYNFCFYCLPYSPSVIRCIGMCVFSFVFDTSILIRISMYKTKRTSRINVRAISEHLKHKYIPGYRYSGLAYDEGLTDYQNAQYYGLGTIGTPSQVRCPIRLISSSVFIDIQTSIRYGIE